MVSASGGFSAAGVARAVRRFPARHRIALTGTPVENDLTELWAILDWTNPGLLGSRNAFRKVWAGPIESGLEPTKARQFADLIEPFLLLDLTFLAANLLKVFDGGWVPLLFGGGNTRLLRWAARHADVVALSGLGRTLADGHQHTARWRTADIDAQVELAGGRPTEALVQHFQVTDDAEAALAEFTADTGLDVDQVRATPYVLVGTAEEIAAAVRGHERRWGITRFAVRRSALDGIEPVLRLLAQ